MNKKQTLSLATISAVAALVLLPKMAMAALDVKPGNYKVTTILTQIDKKNAKLVVNPMSRSRYVLKVHNPDEVAKWMKQNNYFGQVEAEFELFNPKSDQAAVRIKSIKPVTVEKLPTYDGKMKEVTQ